MRDYKNELRAFEIKTANSTCSTDYYIVIAHNFAEAEDIYWEELHGYYEILSIKQIENTEKVAFRVTKNI